jgi:hypothetical protein
MANRTASRVWLPWALLLAAPLAWSASQLIMLWLTHPVCQGKPRAAIWVVGGIGAAVAVAAGAVAWRALGRRAEAAEGAAVDAFMLKAAMGTSAIFALVILLSLAPVGLLTPCPV